jgi:hypothetical protein
MEPPADLRAGGNRRQSAFAIVLYAGDVLFTLFPEPPLTLWA